MVTTKKTHSKTAVKSAKTQSVKKANPLKAKSRRKAVVNKVDYYPNRMTFWVSAAAGSVFVLFAVIFVYL